MIRKTATFVPCSIACNDCLYIFYGLFFCNRLKPTHQLLILISAKRSTFHGRNKQMVNGLPWTH